MWRLAEDTLDQADLTALADWVSAGPQLTQGPKVAEFEQAWADWVGTEHAVMVSSGSTANLALVTAAAKGRDLRIGASAVTWPTNITPGMMLGHSTVLIDIDPRTLGLDQELAIEAMESGAIDILFVTHLLGFNSLSDEVLDAAERTGVTVLEDCCEAHGATHNGRRVGSLSDGSTFSFYFGHHMSTVEGGMINTNDAELADQLRLIRNHGLARSSTRFEHYADNHPDIDRRFLFVETGMNYRSTDINAFLGLRQLQVIDERIEQRNRNLHQFLAEAPDWLRTDYATAGVSSFALPLIAHDENGYAAVTKAVESLGIEARPVVAGNLMRQPFLKDNPTVSAYGSGLPNAEDVHRFGLYIGNGHHVTSDMISELSDGLRKAR